MYKCRYTFWDEENFPGFKDALSNLYDRSINNYFINENHDSKDQRRDLECIYNVFPLIEYYYVSLIKLGYVDKKNYSNILNQLKSIDCIGVLKPGALRGVTLGKKISFNPAPEALGDLSSNDMNKLVVFHELGHIICESYNKDIDLLCNKFFNNSKIREKLNSYGIKSKNDLIGGFILLEDVLVQEVAEDVLYRDKGSLRPDFYYYQNNNFPGVKYRSNYSLYTIFQELGLKFFRCFDFIDCGRETTVSGVLKKSALKGFNSKFVNNIDDEISTDFDNMSDFALMIGCLGKIKNASYADFGLGVEDKKSNNSYYYNLYMSLVNSKLKKKNDEKKSSI